ncbi:hypothetical protein KLEP181_gp46 [Paracoccus phage vB_PmaP_KLEP18-1]|nr:hypothetical protein KLEP181_gp46 [Paracoccus phage vB_PmaP_KLEP18-1]
MIAEAHAEYDRLTRLDQLAHDFARATAALPPDERLTMLEGALDIVRAGMPTVVHGTIMEQARFWAERAARAELKAYAAACFAQMSDADQAAFLEYGKRIHGKTETERA